MTVIPTVGDEALRGTPRECVDEIARAIQREPLKFIGIAAIVGFALCLRCVSNQVSVLWVVGSSLTPTLLR
jgi:hypothetical protein